MIRSDSSMRRLFSLVVSFSFFLQCFMGFDVNSAYGAATAPSPVPNIPAATWNSWTPAQQATAIQTWNATPPAQQQAMMQQAMTGANMMPNMQAMSQGMPPGVSATQAMPNMQPGKIPTSADMAKMGMTPDQIAAAQKYAQGMTPAQMSSMTPGQIQNTMQNVIGLTPGQMNNISNMVNTRGMQPGAMNMSEIQGMPSQVMMTPDQVRTMMTNQGFSPKDIQTALNNMPGNPGTASWFGSSARPLPAAPPSGGNGGSNTVMGAPSFWPNVNVGQGTYNNGVMDFGNGRTFNLNQQSNGVVPYADRQGFHQGAGETAGNLGPQGLPGRLNGGQNQQSNNFSPSAWSPNAVGTRNPDGTWKSYTFDTKLADGSSITMMPTGRDTFRYTKDGTTGNGYVQNGKAIFDNKALLPVDVPKEQLNIGMSNAQIQPPIGQGQNLTGTGASLQPLGRGQTGTPITARPSDAYILPGYDPGRGLGLIPENASSAVVKPIEGTSHGTFSYKLHDQMFTGSYDEKAGTATVKMPTGEVKTIPLNVGIPIPNNGLDVPRFTPPSGVSYSDLKLKSNGEATATIKLTKDMSPQQLEDALPRGTQFLGQYEDGIHIILPSLTKPGPPRTIENFTDQRNLSRLQNKTKEATAPPINNATNANGLSDFSAPGFSNVTTGANGVVTATLNPSIGTLPPGAQITGKNTDGTVQVTLNPPSAASPPAANAAQGTSVPSGIPYGGDFVQGSQTPASTTK